MNSRIHILVAAAVGAATGAAAGYIFARKRLETKYALLYEAEIEAAKTINSMFRKTDEFSTPVAAAAALGVSPPEKIDTAVAAEKLVQQLGYRGKDSLSPDAMTRNRKVPYVIREDEYFENDTGFDQKTLTYFKGDDTLCDDADQIIEDVEATVGKANLDTFGRISNDPNVTYVRNEKLRVEYEIVLDHQNYGEVVAGFIKGE